MTPPSENAEASFNEALVTRCLIRRRAALAKRLKPCPRCGNAPVIEFGFLDNPLPDGHEWITCPTVFVNVPGAPDQSCGVHAQGETVWNMRFRGGEE